MSTLGIAICMGLYYWIARLRFGYTISSALLQPTTIAVFVGLITGQMALSMEIGAALQLVYLGVTSTPGGNVPNDPALAGTIAIPLGVMSGMTPELAVAWPCPLASSACLSTSSVVPPTPSGCTWPTSTLRRPTSLESCAAPTSSPR